MMLHGKSLLIGAAGTVQGRLGWASKVLHILNEKYEVLIKESAWLSGAPFSTIHYVVRFGAEASDTVLFSRISKKYDELPVASQMSMQDLHDVFLDKGELERFLERELRRVLTVIGKRYKLPALPSYQ